MKKLSRGHSLRCSRGHRECLSVLNLDVIAELWSVLAPGIGEGKGSSHTLPSPGLAEGFIKGARGFLGAGRRWSWDGSWGTQQGLDEGAFCNSSNIHEVIASLERRPQL